MDSIYLDHAATTPLHPDVWTAMQPYMTDHFGNPSSLHAYGRAARSALTDARDRIAAKLKANTRTIVFTGGGTESDNLALFGGIGGDPAKRHIVTTQIEHHAVLHACERLERIGCDITYVPVEPTGLIQWDELVKAIRPDTALVSVMYANNEVGTIQPIADIAALTRESGILLHVDAVQAVGKLPIDFAASCIDFMSVSAHKLNGPKGVGALVCSAQGFARLEPRQYGGNQERGRRAGTENVAGIVGFAKAFELTADSLETTQERHEACRQAMLDTFAEQLPHGAFVVNGHPDKRLPHIVNVSFPGLSTETLLMSLDLAGIAAASGSACTSGSHERSHVLLAMGLPDDVAGSAVRFSFGWGHTPELIRKFSEKVATIVRRLRNS